METRYEVTVGVGFGSLVENVDGDLGLGPSVGDDVFLSQTQSSGDFDDGIELGVERNIEIYGYNAIMPLLPWFVTTKRERIRIMCTEFRPPQLNSCKKL